ncbi:MAG: hypothetical protein NC548_25730 [Lachnospiraceae bacterium]|nr:hypothetical protein [Lachnospiraceae bacterium]
MKLTLNLTDAESDRLDLMREEIRLQGIINSRYDSLNDYQKESIKAEQLKFSLLKQEAETTL